MVKTLINEYLKGGPGKGNILFHGKKHKNDSGIFACVRGISECCENVIDCENCYDKKEGSYCLKDGQSIKGFLAIEDKHEKLVKKGATGAYTSIRSAMKKLTQ